MRFRLKTRTAKPRPGVSCPGELNFGSPAFNFNRQLNHRVIAAALILLVLAAGSGQRLFASDRDSPILFSWALIFQGSDGITKPIDYNDNVVRLESGDRFKFYLNPPKSCYIYLYLYDAQKNLFLVFPEDFELFEQSTQISRNYELPGVNSWFYLDENRGTETFFLIASTRRLNELEQSTLRHLEDRTASGQNLRVLTSKHEVLDEIRRLIKETSYLADVAQKPIAVAGDFRGIREERELNGVRIEATEIYVKTIRLQH